MKNHGSKDQEEEHDYHTASDDPRVPRRLPVLGNKETDKEIAKWVRRGGKGTAKGNEVRNVLVVIKLKDTNTDWRLKKREGEGDEHRGRTDICFIFMCMCDK